jgi:hypothetical protein
VSASAAATSTSKIPLPSEPRPLYEILQEVKTSASTNDLYAPSHTYAIPSSKGTTADQDHPEVNIQKVIDTSAAGEKATGGDKDDEKKKKEKKDKYKVKF